MKRGVFATRSPHRPNPLGISAVELIRIEGRRVYVGSNDLLDGTPILDIKPYLPEVDSFPDSKIGWLSEVVDAHAAPPLFTVEIGSNARAHLQWLKDKWDIDLVPRVCEILSRDPTPHRTRRIVRCDDGGYRIGCGAWRLFFRVAEDRVVIERVAPGYPARALAPERIEGVPHGEAQREFFREWCALHGGRSRSPT